MRMLCAPARKRITSIIVTQACTASTGCLPACAVSTATSSDWLM